MIPYIMVEPKQWSEMVKAMEENARIKAERVHDLNQIGGLQQELARLRASSFVTAVTCEQYERVVKTGDAMLWFISKKTNASVYADIANEWNAAKEGKPSV